MKKNLKIIHNKKTTTEERSCFTCDHIIVCETYSEFREVYEKFERRFPDKNEVGKIFDAICRACIFYKPREQ